MTSEKGRLGILVGGGPAPGINGAISAATIEAINSGIEVIGIDDGFAHLVEGDASHIRRLQIEDVSRVHTQGGSILRTTRTNPSTIPNGLKNSVQALNSLGVKYLVTIGGEDTAFGASEVAKVADGVFRVAHIPKTIDNDLPLPGDTPTFGFQTARHVGTNLVLNLMEDSRTTNRWYIVVAMGRKAGHLAMGIGMAAGATVTIIPEDFPEPQASLDDICGVLEGAILKRKVQGRDDGLAVIAEGVAERINPEELANIPGVEIALDPYGHIRLGEIPLATILRRQIQQRFAARGIDMTIVDSTMGYELRCAPPIPFDIEYTRTLGHGAVRFLLTANSDEVLKYGGLVCLQAGRLHAMPFEDLREPDTGAALVRLVDTESVQYEVACKYQIRLTQADLDDPVMLAGLAKTADMPTEDFLARFGPIVKAL